MNRLLRLCGLFLLSVSLAGTTLAQLSAPKVSRIEIKHVGPPAAAEELIRANIRVKTGDTYQPNAVDDDLRNLYATGLFYNIRVAQERADDGTVVLTYIVQGKPRLVDIKLQGNKKVSDAKIKKKITSKVGDPLDERKLFTDSQAIQELYQKRGFPSTEVKYVPNIDENAGRGGVTFEIKESPKIKIANIEFVGNQAFTQKQLRQQVLGWWRRNFAWLFGYGKFKDDKFQEDKQKLIDFFRDHGYLDAEIQKVEFINPEPGRMIIRYHIYEGKQYRVGNVTFKGTTMMDTNSAIATFKLKPGAVFAPKDMLKDVEKVEDFYGARGHIDVAPGTPNLRVTRVANTESGTMDLQYEVDEGQKSYIEKIEIRGNNKTKDKVIRRELAVSPGETFDMVRVKVSKRRLEGLQYFEPGKVDARPEPTTVPNRKDLVVSVEEKNTGNLMVGAGFSSVDAIVGFVEVSEGNFDLFNPPRFGGGGQKFRLRVQLGTKRQDEEISFVEPWFLGRKLALGVDLYHTEKSFLSLGNLYDEDRTGARVSLSRALGSDFLIGSVSYTIESVGILLDPAVHGERTVVIDPPGPPIFTQVQPPNAPQAILSEAGYSFLTRVGASLAYDTRNSTFLPDGGQRTEISTEVTSSYLGGERDFYRINLSTSWYFRGLFKGHVLELIGQTGVAEGLRGDDVPFYERFYLGGLYTLRGYEYREISPREPGFTEPIGGRTMWFGSAEYSIPIIQKEKMGGVRFAFFYDIGNVMAGPYDYNFSNYSDNWGFGLRLNLPIGPLRLDYGIPIKHDPNVGGSGRFQFGVGWHRPF